MKKFICMLFLLLPVIVSAEMTPEYVSFELIYLNGKWVYPTLKGQRLYIQDNKIYTSAGVGKYIATEGIHTPFSFNAKIYTIADIEAKYKGHPSDNDVAVVTLIKGVNRFDVNQDGRIDYSDLTELENRIGESE